MLLGHRSPTTTTVSSSANPSTYGNSATFTAPVAGTDGGGTVIDKVRMPFPTDDYSPFIQKIKDSKLKVQAAIQGDLVRISGKDRDTLQQVIALLRGQDFGIELQFINFRTN